MNVVVPSLDLASIRGRGIPLAIYVGMHGCSLAFGLPINAEVDSMGGVVEAGDGVGTRPSPRRVAIVKVQADLRQEYDFREEKRRELDFLEKGGDPLDFKFGNPASTSVQSTSLNDQLPELFVTSEAKDSIAFTASTHGDSVESSGAPGAQSALEPISSDNLMLFDGDTDSIEGDRVPKQPKKSNIALADHSFNLDGIQNAKYIGDSGAVGLARIAYNRRRYRSQPGRHAGRSSSSDMVLAQGINGSSLHSFGGHGDFEGLVSDRGQNQKVSGNGDLKPKSPVSSAVCQTTPSNIQMDSGLGIVKAVESANDSSKDDPVNDAKDSEAMQNLHDDPHNLDSSCVVHKYPRTQSLEEPYAFRASEEVAVEGLEFSRPAVPVTVIQTHGSSGHMNGSSFANVDVKITPNGSMTNNIGLVSNVLESVSSCTQTRLSLDGNNDIGVQTNGRCLDASGSILVSALGSDETIQADHMRKERDGTRADEKKELVIDDCGTFKESLKENGFLLKAEEDTNANVSGLEDEVENHTQNNFIGQSTVESMDVDSCGAGRNTDAPSGVNMDPEDENVCKAGLEFSSEPSIEKHPKTEPPTGISNSASVKLTLTVTDLKARRADEDLILEEARIIEAKRRRMVQLSLSNTSVHFHSRSHWDFVLEEMAWLANDFAQERLWKISAASQVGHWVSLLSRMRFHEKNSIIESRKKAQFLARSVMEFWHSPVSKSQGTELQFCSRDCSPALREYALRFRKKNPFEARNVEVQAPVTPDRASDVAVMDTSLGDRSQEEKLLYVVPPDAMVRYRNSVESYTATYEKTGSGKPEEFETSTSDTVADNVYDEDEAETSTYDLYVPLDSSKSSNYSQKQLKSSTRAYGARNLEVVADSPSMQCVDNKVRSQQPVLMGKRPANSLNVSFPTKRVRSSNRQRVLCSFTAGTSAYVQGTTKPVASSGDTNYFQDDQNTLDGVSPALDNLAVESVRDFEKPFGYESAEVSTQMKRKKTRHLGSAYERRWQVDCNFQSDQREDSNKRLDSHQFESNGSSGGLFGHHVTKKLKVIKQQSVDNAIDSSSALLGGSAPSPVASQISNPNKFAKYFGGRDRARKTKLVKIPSGQSGPGSPWSLFEEQALVVLVHDLGPNWELVSDAINSTLQFKCIFRNPKECKDRHKQLMDRTSGDGADSADDSGSSQAYSSTLPGIPKGSARQLFQRLQGPMEEDTVKSHFEKIIMIGQKLHGRRKQEPKQIQPPHGSHMVALNQVYPNNLNGVPILTPLDLCDVTGSGSDVLTLTYPGAHSGVLPAPNQGIMTPMLPASGANSPAVGSFNITAGNSFSSPPVPANASLRDARHATSKSASLVIEEQKIQQYNQMLAGRNVSQSNLPSPGPLPANDRGVRMLPGGNGVTISGGGNRSLPTAYQGIAGVKMPSPVNIHGGVGCVQGNPSRPHEALHMIRDPQHQVMLPELQMQVSQGSNQGITPYGAISSSFPNQTASLPVPSHPLHHQQPHTMPPQQLHSISPRHPHVHGNNHTPNLQHQAYAIRLAKDRQMQQRRLQLQQQRQQQQQHFPPHNSLMPHAQSQAQLPISSPLHNSSQVSSQTTPLVTVSSSTPGSPMTAVPQHEHQHQMMPHGFAKNAQAANSSMTNQMGKQRRRQVQQQLTQSGRHHPQQQKPVQTQQQAKVLNRLGQGNAVHQNMAMDASRVNSPSVNAGNHSAENGEQSIHRLQGQGLYSSSAKNPVSAGKPLVRQSSNQSQHVQRLPAGQVSSISKNLQQMPCNSVGANQGQVSPVSSPGTLSSCQPSVPSVVKASSGNQHSQLAGRPKLVNQSELSVERVLQQNHPLNSDSTKLLMGIEPQNDQISSRRGTVPTSSRTSNDITNVPKVISPVSTTPWRGSESTYNSGISSAAAHLGASGTPAFTEPSSQVVQGSGERHSSDNLPSEGHDVGMQWQQKPSHLQQPPHALHQLQQQQESSQQQLLPSSASQSQTQYVRPPDSILE